MGWSSSHANKFLAVNRNWIVGFTFSETGYITRQTMMIRSNEVFHIRKYWNNYQIILLFYLLGFSSIFLT